MTTRTGSGARRAEVLSVLPGTRIATARGPVMAEHLACRDRLVCHDAGPVAIRARAMGPAAHGAGTVTVPPDWPGADAGFALPGSTRLLLWGWAVQLHVFADEALAEAGDILPPAAPHTVRDRVHLILDTPALVRANGVLLASRPVSTTKGLPEALVADFAGAPPTVTPRMLLTAAEAPLAAMAMIPPAARARPEHKARAA